MLNSTILAVDNYSNAIIIKDRKEVIEVSADERKEIIDEIISDLKEIDRIKKEKQEKKKSSPVFHHQSVCSSFHFKNFT